MKWWRKRMSKPGVLPENTMAAVGSADALLKPTEIKVQKNGKYTEIVEFRFVPGVSSGSTGVPVHPAGEKTERLKAILQHAMYGRSHDR